MEKQSRARYTREVKDEAIRLVTNGGRVSEVARNRGLPIKPLANWLRQTKNGEGTRRPAGRRAPVAEWLAGTPLAKTRQSRFAALQTPV